MESKQFNEQDPKTNEFMQLSASLACISLESKQDHYLKHCSNIETDCEVPFPAANYAFLQNRLRDLKTDLTGILQQKDALTSKIDKIQREAREAEAQLLQLDGQEAAVQDEIKKFEAFIKEIADKHSEMRKLQQTINSLRSAIQVQGSNGKPAGHRNQMDAQD